MNPVQDFYANGYLRCDFPLVISCCIRRSEVLTRHLRHIRSSALPARMDNHAIDISETNIKRKLKPFINTCFHVGFT